MSLEITCKHAPLVAAASATAILKAKATANMTGSCGICTAYAPELPQRESTNNNSGSNSISSSRD